MRSWDRVAARGSLACVLSVVLLGCGAIPPEVTGSLNLTSVYLKSEASVEFIVRFESDTADPPSASFVLPPHAQGDALATLTAWAGRLEVLDSACSVVGTLPIEASSRAVIVVRADGEPVRTPSSDVIGGAPTQSLGQSAKCATGGVRPSE